LRSERIYRVFSQSATSEQGRLSEWHLP